MTANAKAAKAINLIISFLLVCEPRRLGRDNLDIEFQRDAIAIAAAIPAAWRRGRNGQTKILPSTSEWIVPEDNRAEVKFADPDVC
jgi:hypothetical protein